MKNAVLIMPVVIATIFVFAPFSTPVFAQDDEFDPVSLVDPPLIPFENLDLNGTWILDISKPTVSGGCPAGSFVDGTAAITQQESEVTFKYTSGARCRPAAVCSYTGTLEKEGNQFAVANSVTVDDEGGTVSSAVVLTVFNNGLARGKGTSHYVHPEGFECRWNMTVVLSRELDEEEDTGEGTGKDKEVE